MVQHHKSKPTTSLKFGLWELKLVWKPTDFDWWPIDFYSTAELTDHLKFVLLICQSQLVFILILVPIDQISWMWLVWIYGVAPFSTIFQFISWSVSLMDETEILGENHLWQELDLQLPVQSVPITTNIVSSSPVHGEVYLMQHYVIKFISYLPQVVFS
jgi:hypothetical protein